MSFNYLEVAEATRHIQSLLPATVESVELVEFPLAAPLADVNIALRLSQKKTVVFALKTPWVGIFTGSPGKWKISKTPWMKIFKGDTDWNSYVRGQQLLTVDAVANDRIVKLSFENGTQVEIELFPARPNWALKNAQGTEITWRDATNHTKPAFTRPLQTVSLRDFATFSGNSWIDRAYQFYLKARQSALLESLIQKASQQLQGRLQQLIKIRAEMSESLEESKKSELYRAQGEDLKSVLHAYPQKQKLVKIAEFPTIKLDAKLTLSENAMRLFARYKKLERTKREVEARLSGIEDETRKVTAHIGKFRTFASTIKVSDEKFESHFEKLKPLLSEAQIKSKDTSAAEKKPSKQDLKWMKSGIRQFHSNESLAIWVGRNHKENEQLVIRMARGNDMWLHLKGKPGAHVIVQLPSGKTPSLETLLDAATLAAYYSGVGSNSKVEVDYTFRKFVKRVPGKADHFLVTYSQNKTLMLKMEEQRLWRLLKQHSS